MAIGNAKGKTKAMREAAEALVRRTQDEICTAATALDPVGFREDSWQREGGGGGWTRVLADGDVFEKAGVNVSVVHGRLGVEAARAMGGGQGLGEDALDFWACGVSTVLHPRNPMAPTAHANYRYFERLDDAGQVRAAWFGGGADLTPSYLFEDDAVHFHRLHREACENHAIADHDALKRWCDEYFVIAHRGEARGVGGVFFDDFGGEDLPAAFAFVESCAAAFVPAYFPIVERRASAPFTGAERRWQQLRRGRYVEFNLIYDRGTIFGLRTAGRIESVLMSLPLTARWEYDHHPEAGSREAALLDVLREPRDWLADV